MNESFLIWVKFQSFICLIYFPEFENNA